MKQPSGIIRLVFLTALILLLGGCVDVDTGTELAEEDLRFSLPTQEFKDVILTHSDAGQTMFELEAPHLDRYDRQEKAVFYGGIEIRFFEDGQVSSRLTSERGEVLNNGEELVAIGNVVVTTDTGTTILTPRLRWNQDTKLITNDTTVTIITQYDTLRGSGLVATDDLRMKRIMNPTGVSYRSVDEDRGGGGLMLSPPREGEEDKVDSLAVPPLDVPPPPPVNQESPAPLSPEATVTGPSAERNLDSLKAQPFQSPAPPNPDSTRADTSAANKAGEGAR